MCISCWPEIRGVSVGCSTTHAIIGSGTAGQSKQEARKELGSSEDNGEVVWVASLDSWHCTWGEQSEW